MANKKISDYTADTSPASTDLVETLDVSDTTYAVTGTNKKVLASDLITKAHGLGNGVLKTAAGVMAVATAGTDYYNPGGTDVAVVDGGTGASTKAAGFDALSPMTASGDIIYGGASGTGTKLIKGSDGDVLKLASGLPSWAASSAGQTLFEAIVATSGGDYTTLKAALDAGKTRIFIRNGTYTETATASNPLTTAGIYICGESPEGVVLSYGTTAQTFSGANVVIENVKFSFSTGGLTLSGAQAALIGCHIANSSGTNTTITMSGAKALFDNNIYIDSGVGADPLLSFTGDNSRITNNYFEMRLVDSGGVGINLAAKHAAFAGNTIKHAAGDNQIKLLSINTNGWGTTVTGNTFLGTLNFDTIGVYCQSTTGSEISGNGFYLVITCVKTADSFVTITGNTFELKNNSAAGAQLSGGSNHVVSGNIITNKDGASGITGVDISAGNDHVVTGNNFPSIATGVAINASARNRVVVVGNNFSGDTTAVSDAGTATTLADNIGMSILQEKHFVLMKNTSGSTINAGNAVTYKAVAAGDEVTTTTSASDNQVFGMAESAISNNAYGYVQIRGKTTKLTADGTTDIAVGDFLTTFTSAGIVAKASAGQLAIAIALEAYTANDSLGVLDALIITPRRL